jgi:hypothetical protein
MILEVIGSFVSGLFHTLGTRFAGTLMAGKIRKTEKISDQETWNIITCYGKYSDVWEIYRNKGLIEAIKARDEKVDFDHRLELGRISNDASKFSKETHQLLTQDNQYPEIWTVYTEHGLFEAIKLRDKKLKLEYQAKIQKYDLEIGQLKLQLDSIRSAAISKDDKLRNDHKIEIQKLQNKVISLQLHIDAHYSPKPQEYRVNDSDRSQALDNLDLALIRGLSSYFETMSGKIRHYHKSHKASEEEAEVIANYFLEIGRKLMKVKTQADLKVLLTSLESLKEKVSRYQHESYKYRWSTSLEKDVITKVRKVVDSFQS